MRTIHEKLNVECPLIRASAHIRKYFSHQLDAQHIFLPITSSLNPDGVTFIAKEMYQQPDNQSTLYHWQLALSATKNSLLGTMSIAPDIRHGYFSISIDEISQKRDGAKFEHKQIQSERIRARSFFRDLLLEMRTFVEYREEAMNQFDRLLTVNGDYKPSLRPHHSVNLSRKSLGSIYAG